MPILPSGSRSREGAYSPSSSRRHHSALLALRFQIGEPILINHGADLLRRRAAERISGEQRKHIRLVIEQALLGPDDEAVILPWAKRGEPQIPIETRLIRGVNSRRRFHILRLVAKWIGDPCFAVARALKFNFVARVRHHCEKAVAFGDAKRLEPTRGVCGKGSPGTSIRRAASRLHRKSAPERQPAKIIFSSAQPPSPAREPYAGSVIWLRNLVISRRRGRLRDSGDRRSHGNAGLGRDR